MNVKHPILLYFTNHWREICNHNISLSE